MNRRLFIVVQVLVLVVVGTLAAATAWRTIPSLPATSSVNEINAVNVAGLDTSSKLPLHNVVTVAKSGGQYTTITSALNSITDASPTNHYLIWVAPGTYTETVRMKQYVDIEGAGEKATKITSGGSSSNNTGTVWCASNAELRSLTVENTGGNLWAIGIFNSSASPSLLNVTAIAFSGTNDNWGMQNTSSSSPIMTNVTLTASGGSGTVNIGMHNGANSSPTMTNVTLTASGGSGSLYNYGLYNDSSYATINNMTATALGTSGSNNYGVFNFQSTINIQTSIMSGTGGTNAGVYSEGGRTVTIDNSKITGSTNTIFNISGTTTRVGASQMSGGPVFNTGTLTCSASYDENYVSPGLNVCP